MALEKRFLSYAMMIGGTPEHDPDRLDELAFTLAVEQEAFPYLFLKGEAFLKWKKLREVIYHAAKSANLAAGTRRKKTGTDYRMAETSRAQLYAAARETIQQELQLRSIHSALDKALERALVSNACPSIPLRMKIQSEYRESPVPAPSTEK